MNGFYKKLDEPKLLISEFDTICLQEINFSSLKFENTGSLSHTKKKYTNGMSNIRASGGTAMYIKPEYPSKPVNSTHNSCS